MDERYLLAFLDSSIAFFNKVTGEPALHGTAELIFNSVKFHDLVGRIDISGSAAGHFYMTCSSELLEDFLKHLGEPDRSYDTLRDAMGEIASVIASNCRREFGQHFQISVPKVLTAEEAAQHTEEVMAFLLPLTWNGHQAQLLISLEGDAS